MLLDTEGEEPSSSTHSPYVQVGEKKIFKASAVKGYTGPHAGKASRDRLARMRNFTTLAGGRLAEGSASWDDSGTALQVGSPFAALFRLRTGRQQPVSYGVGVLVVTVPPAAGGEAADDQVVKGQLMRITLIGGDGNGSTFEWENRKLHTATTYSCSLALVEELNPTLEVDKQTHGFSIDELITTQHLLQAEVERVQGWAAVPDVRPPPRNKVAPLPLHDDLTCMAGGASGAEEVPTASVDGKVECPRCFSEVGAKLLPQHMGGHILQNEGRQQRNTCGFCGGDVGEKCKTWVVEAKTGKAAPQIHSTCSLAPKVDSRSSRVALGLKALLKPTSSTPCTNAPLKCLFCSPDKWVWKYSMSHHIESEHATSLALNEADPNTEKFTRSFAVGEAEKAAVLGKLKGKGTAVRAPVARRTVPHQKSTEEEEEEEEEEEGGRRRSGRKRLKKRRFSLVEGGGGAWGSE